MAEPLRDILEIILLGEKQACGSMTKVVEPDDRQIIRLQYLLELGRNIAWGEDMTIRPLEYIIVFNIRISGKLAVYCLTFLDTEESLPDF